MLFVAATAAIAVYCCDGVAFVIAIIITDDELRFFFAHTLPVFRPGLLLFV